MNILIDMKTELCCFYIAVVCLAVVCVYFPVIPFWRPSSTCSLCVGLLTSSTMETGLVVKLWDWCSLCAKDSELISMSHM